MAAEREAAAPDSVLAAIYASGAAMMLTPSLLVFSVLHPPLRGVLYVTMIDLFSPLRIPTLLIGMWFVCVARRSRSGRPIATAHLRTGEWIAAVLGGLTLVLGVDLTRDLQARHAHAWYGVTITAVGLALLAVALSSRIVSRRAATVAAHCAP